MAFLPPFSSWQNGGILNKNYYSYPLVKLVTGTVSVYTGLSVLSVGTECTACTECTECTECTVY